MTFLNVLILELSWVCSLRTETIVKSSTRVAMLYKVPSNTALVFHANLLVFLIGVWINLLLLLPSQYLLPNKFQEQRTAWNKEFIWGLLGLQPGRHRFKKHFSHVPSDYKMQADNKGKNCKATVSYKSCLSRIIIATGKK